MSDSSDSSKPRPKTAAVPHYTVGEEIMNSVTHGVGCLLGIAGLVLLIVFAALRGGGPAHMAAAIVYGVSIILEYLASTLYHAIQPARAKRVFRIIDHSCIYLLIAGSYTPFCLITLAPYGEAFYRAVFSADLLPTEGGFLHGTLTCDLRTQGDGQSTLSQLENRITTLAPVREEPILSPAQALAALQSGKSFEGAWFAQSVQQIEVRFSTLDYLSDSKGFYQPVYRFELSLAGQAGGITDAVDYVPALF